METADLLVVTYSTICNSKAKLAIKQAGGVMAEV